MFVITMQRGNGLWVTTSFDDPNDFGACDVSGEGDFEFKYLVDGGTGAYGAPVDLSHTTAIDVLMAAKDAGYNIPDPLPSVITIPKFPKGSVQ